jgi:hypothetical protein
MAMMHAKSTRRVWFIITVTSVSVAMNITNFFSVGGLWPQASLGSRAVLHASKVNLLM